MPFTPIHMGPGLLIKSILQGCFSLMVFGWAQILMDIQPLIVMITGVGHLHGFSHTYIGATLIAILATLTGKHLSEFGLLILGISKRQNPIKISWLIALLSAFIGTFSHVFLDSIMHADVEPFYPVLAYNSFYGMISISALHKLCFYSGIVGTGLYFLIQYFIKKR